MTAVSEVNDSDSKTYMDSGLIFKWNGKIKVFTVRSHRIRSDNECIQ